MSRLTESDIAQMDLQVRELSDYSSDELITLQFAVVLAFEQARPEKMPVLEAWQSRIRDAIKAAHERETELPY